MSELRLSAEDERWSIDVGRRRYENAIAKRLADRGGRDDVDAHVFGARGELAALASWASNGPPASRMVSDFPISTLISRSDRRIAACSRSGLGISLERGASCSCFTGPSRTHGAWADGFGSLIFATKSSAGS
jgi:hypothetical protein